MICSPFIPFAWTISPGAFLIVWVIGLGTLVLPVFYLVHGGLAYCCLLHAQRFCRKNNLRINRWRCGPTFDASGSKTEFTLVELDCLDGQEKRKLVRLHVWVFGVHRILNIETFPESQGEPVV